MYKSFLLSIAAIIGTQYAAAQEKAGSWTLEECIRYAIENNISLKQIEQDKENKKVELMLRRNNNS